MIKLEDVFEAYYECRKNKRKTKQQLEFELNLEENCIQLYNDIVNREYEIGQSICFIITRPKPREVFAANFRDRIIHHLVIGKLNPYFEKEFINNTFNCRKNKGVLYGIKTLQENIKECSNNFTQDCYIAKFDFKNFFMTIDKNILYNKLEKFIIENYNDEDVLYLSKKIIFNCPQKNSSRRSIPQLWNLLDKGKSLFDQDENTGLPIGNLSSQVFANFFLNEFDHILSEYFDFYGRYVDDFYIIDRDKDKILNYISKIKELANSIKLTIHPNKVYIQPYYRGCSFIGGVVKNNRIYTGKRTINNCLACIHNYNKIIDKEKYVDDFIKSLNSYFGYMIHSKSFNVRNKIIKTIDTQWLNYLRVAENCNKFIKI